MGLLSQRAVADEPLNPNNPLVRGPGEHANAIGHAARDHRSLGSAVVVARHAVVPCAAHAAPFESVDPIRMGTSRCARASRLAQPRHGRCGPRASPWPRWGYPRRRLLIDSKGLRLLLPLALAHDHDLLGSDTTTVERALPCCRRFSVGWPRPHHRVGSMSQRKGRRATPRSASACRAELRPPTPDLRGPPDPGSRAR